MSLEKPTRKSRTLTVRAGQSLVNLQNRKKAVVSPRPSVRFFLPSSDRPLSRAGSHREGFTL
jgi:hypothetical protein